ncbi:MAG: transposase [Candidatus Electronema sp. VV]
MLRRQRHDYYGFKLCLRISRLGMITSLRLASCTSARYSKHRHPAGGAAPADKGFIDERRQSLLLERHGIFVVTPPRKNMKTTLPESLLKFCRRIRKRIETVGSHLTERFKIDHIRVHDLWHFQHRLIRKILAHTVCVFISLTYNHPPFHLDGLIAV